MGETNEHLDNQTELQNGPSESALAIPDAINLTTEERIEFLANLIVERISEDKAQGYLLLQKIKGSSS
jgi:hypothetical protein